jgi:hypothetical protein
MDGFTRRRLFKALPCMLGGSMLLATRAVAAPRIASYFAHANLPHLKYELIEQFCNLANGPCT